LVYIQIINGSLDFGDIQISAPKRKPADFFKSKSVTYRHAAKGHSLVGRMKFCDFPSWSNSQTRIKSKIKFLKAVELEFDRFHPWQGLLIYKQAKRLSGQLVYLPNWNSICQLIPLQRFVNALLKQLCLIGCLLPRYKSVFDKMLQLRAFFRYSTRGTKQGSKLAPVSYTPLTYFRNWSV